MLAEALFIVLAGYIVKFLITLYKTRRLLEGLLFLNIFTNLRKLIPYSLSRHSASSRDIQSLWASSSGASHPITMHTRESRAQYSLPSIFSIDTIHGTLVIAIAPLWIRMSQHKVTVQTSLPKHAAIDGAIWLLVRPNNKVGPKHKC